MTSDSQDNISYNAELGRKAIHLGSMVIPIGAYLFPLPMGLAILAFSLAVSLVIDLERTLPGPIGRFINGRMGYMMRPHEKQVKRGGFIPMSGATWMLISAILTFALFPREIAVAAFSMLILCDTAAALVGRRFGRIRFGPRRKSLEGSLAFFITGVTIVALTPSLPMVAGIIGAAAATVAEAAPWEVDDNFSIPLSAGLVMWLLLGSG